MCFSWRCICSSEGGKYLWLSAAIYSVPGNSWKTTKAFSTMSRVLMLRPVFLRLRWPSRTRGGWGGWHPLNLLHRPHNGRSELTGNFSTLEHGVRNPSKTKGNAKLIPPRKSSAWVRLKRWQRCCLDLEDAAHTNAHSHVPKYSPEEPQWTLAVGFWWDTVQSRPSRENNLGWIIVGFQLTTLDLFTTALD